MCGTYLDSGYIQTLVMIINQIMTGNDEDKGGVDAIQNPGISKIGLTPLPNPATLADLMQQSIKRGNRHVLV